MGMGLPSFLWGVATSAYQVEGAPDNDWTEWEQLERLKVRGGAAAARDTSSAGAPISSSCPRSGPTPIATPSSAAASSPSPAFFGEALAFEASGWPRWCVWASSLA